MSITATARAPATTGNAAVGFDILGFACGVIADTVTVRRVEKPGVRVVRVSDERLPLETARNTASVAVAALAQTVDTSLGFEIEIDKGIPLGSGLGGSAASAVGAVVAANATLDEPRTLDELFGFALAGEAVSTGHAHPDNVAPCLYGGLTLTGPAGVQVLPAPPLWVALVHSDQTVETRAARAVLPREVPMSTAVDQMRYLATFVDACHRGDALMAARACKDVLIEPHRRELVTGFDAAARAARACGALAFSLSGSGPTVFALALNEADATIIRDEIRSAFVGHGLQTTAWVCELGTAGAGVIQ